MHSRLWLSLISATETHKERGNGFAFKPHTPEDAYASTIAHTTGGMVSKTDNFIAEPQINILGQLSSSQNSRIISADGISPAVINGEKDGMPKIAEPLLIPQATKEGYAVVPEGGVFDASYPDSTTRRGRVQEGGTVSPTIMASQNELLRYEGTAQVMQIGNLVSDTKFDNPQRGRVYSTEGIAPCLNGIGGGGNLEPKVPQGIRIRRLTERELYRLMDVEEKDIDTLLSAPIPRTQHAKLAGNSIVVACLYHIFHHLFVTTDPTPGTQTKLF